MLLDQLWEFLVCPNLPNQPMDMPISKLIELILMLTTLTNYELVILHLQHQAIEGNKGIHWDADLPEDIEQIGESSSITASSGSLDDDEEVCGDTRVFQSSFSHWKTPPSSSEDRTDWDSEEHHWPPEIRIQRADVGRRMHLDTTPLPSNEASCFMIPGESKRPRLAASIVSSYLARSQVPSTLESNVYKNPHEGSRLKAFKPDDPQQSAHLKEMFSSCSYSIEVYKRAARKELYELYHLAHGSCRPLGLSDKVVVQLAMQCRTSAGASGVFRLVQEELLPDEDYHRCHHTKSPSAITSREDPIQKVTPAVLTLLMVREIEFFICGRECVSGIHGNESW